MSEKKFKHIIFDCSDTLLHLGGKELLYRLTGSEKRGEDIHTRLFSSPAWREYDCGRMDEKELEGALLPLLKEGDRDIGERYLKEWIHTYTIIDGIPELLDQLVAQGITLYILSDFPPCFEILWNGFDLFRRFSGRVVSYEEGIRKEDPHLFEICLNKYALSAEDCLFVDDLMRNVINARKVGIAGHQFTTVAALRKELGL